MTSINDIKIPEPCPMALSRLQGENDEYFCMSCSKTIIDYSQLSIEELKQTIKKEQCGIFNYKQVIVPKMTFRRRALFISLSMFSVFGFLVKPVSAQTEDSIMPIEVNLVVDSVPDKVKSDSTNTLGKSKLRQRTLFRRKRSHHKRIGCPSF